METRSRRCAFALLPDPDTRNRVTEITMRLHELNPGRLHWLSLPPHVSLKQPFEYEQLEPLTAYFDDIAKALAPFTCPSGELEIQPPRHRSEHIAWIAMKEDPRLRTLHEQLLRELSTVVLDPVASFDGDTYRFHLTLAFVEGEDELLLPAGAAQFSGAPVQFDRLAMFVYDGFPPDPYQYMTYRVRPLGG